MADRGGHASHLAVAALAQGQLDPAGGNALAPSDRWVAGPERGRRNKPRPCRPGRAIAQDNAAPQPLQRCLVGLAFDLHPVDLLQLMARMGNALLQATVIGQHQDRKSTRLNSSHVKISYAVFCLKKKLYSFASKGETV